MAFDKAATQLDDNLQTVLEAPRSKVTQEAAVVERVNFNAWCGEFEVSTQGLCHTYIPLLDSTRTASVDIDCHVHAHVLC
jgi:hypothetical protein